jgi:hypothetical protein
MGSKTERAGFRKTESGKVRAGMYVVMMNEHFGVKNRTKQNIQCLAE